MPSSLISHLRLALRADPTEDPVTTPMIQSSLVSFFHNYPRFGLPREVELSGRYFFGISTAALPWFIIAILCLVLATCATALCGPLRKVKRRARRRAAREEAAAAADGAASSTWRGSTSTSSRRTGQLLFGTVLFNVSFWLIGFGIMASFFFFEGVKDSFLAIRYGLDGVFGASIVLSQFAIISLDKLLQLPNLASIASVLLNDPEGTRARTEEFVRENQRLLDQTNGYLRTARATGIAVYVVLLVLFLSLLGFLFAVFSMQSRGKRGRRNSGCAMCIMLVPLFLSWAAIGIVSVVAVLTADVCGTLGDYHRIILDEANRVSFHSIGINRTKNIIYDSGLECPRNLVESSVIDTVQAFTQGLTNDALADSLFTVLFPNTDPTGVTRFSRKLFNEISDCSSMVRFSGRLHQSVCQSSGPILGLFVIWFALILLAVILTVTFFVAQYSSFDTTRFYTPRHIGKRVPDLAPSDSETEDDRPGGPAGRDVENVLGEDSLDGRSLRVRLEEPGTMQ